MPRGAAQGDRNELPGSRIIFSRSSPRRSRRVLGRSMLLSLAGTAVGLLGAVALTRFLSSLLYEVAPTDPVTFAAATLFLLGASAAGGFLPARRATKVDPMMALRHE